MRGTVVSVTRSDQTYQIDDDASIHQSARARRVAAFLSIAAVVITVTVVAPLVVSTISRLRTSQTSYHAFMQRDLGLEELVSRVSARVEYRVDVTDYWSAPRATWNARRGDCEDYAMLISEYLTARRISHAVVGLSLKPDLQGHVFVVAQEAGGRVVLDPTRATAPTGLERFPADTSLAEIAAEYGVLPATNYGARPNAGDPAPVALIE
jgi:hypothetical protein